MRYELNQVYCYDNNEWDKNKSIDKDTETFLLANNFKLVDILNQFYIFIDTVEQLNQLAKLLYEHFTPEHLDYSILMKEDEIKIYNDYVE